MNVRTLVWLVSAGVTLAGTLAAWQQGYLTSWNHWITLWTTSADQRYTAEQLRNDVLDLVNNGRLIAKLPVLARDPGLEATLEREFTDADVLDINALTKQLRDRMPQYFRLTVCTANGPTLKAVLEEFREFAQKTEPEMNALGCAIRPAVGGLGQNVLVVLGQRLPEFSPEALSESSQDFYFNQCPHCRHQHIVRASRKQHSLGLECPNCRLTYAVVAADENGRFRYVNEFLTGYAPPATFSREESRLHELFTIWTAVHANCAYSKDPGARKNQTDNWQTSLETQRLGHGDCEDSSIFLCDWLLTRGFEARVALGRYGDLGGHAWCVVRVEDKEYLLESTEGRPDPANPPLVSRVGSRYVPEILFDRFALYVRPTVGKNWSGNYWSAKVWTRIEPRPIKPGARRAIGGLTHAATVQMDPSRLARTTFADPAVAPFSELGDIPLNAAVWQVPLPMQKPPAN